jgi:hypothetical protein
LANQKQELPVVAMFVNGSGVLFQHKYCINVPIHVYGAAVDEI